MKSRAKQLGDCLTPTQWPDINPAYTDACNESQYFLLGMVEHSSKPKTQELRQEDYCRFENNLGFIMGFLPTWRTE